MTKLVSSFSPNKRWLVLFSLWILFLSGLIANYVGTPGILQAIRLRSLLESKRAQLNEVQKEIQSLNQESIRLEKSKSAQEREVRKVLGYAANDEIIFDFTPNDQY